MQAPGSLLRLSLLCRRQRPLLTHTPSSPHPATGKGSWSGLNFQFERVRIGADPERQRRCDAFLQVQLLGVMLRLALRQRQALDEPALLQATIFTQSKLCMCTPNPSLPTGLFPAAVL